MNTPTNNKTSKPKRKKKGTTKPSAKSARSTINKKIVARTIKNVARESGRAEQSAIARADLPRVGKYAILRETMPDIPACKAAAIAGYSPATPTTLIDNTPSYKEWAKSVRARRAELSATPGLRLEDSAHFYNNMRHDDLDVDPMTRLKASQALDTVLGHNAPKELTQVTDGDGNNSIPQFLMVINNMGLSPAQLKATLAFKGT